MNLESIANSKTYILSTFLSYYFLKFPKNVLKWHIQRRLGVPCFKKFSIRSYFSIDNSDISIARGSKNLNISYE